MIEGVVSSRIPDEWPKIKPFFENFAERSDGRWTVDGLLADVMRAEKQVWKVDDWQALCLTAVGPEHVEIIACSGVRRHEWQFELEAAIIQWAKALGKRRLFAIVRPGWSKVMAENGYKEKHREMMKEI